MIITVIMMMLLLLVRWVRLRYINRLPILLRLDRSKLERKAATTHTIEGQWGQKFFRCSVVPCDEQKRPRG